PVFDGNITSSKVKQAESQLKELNIAEADLIQNIRLELEQIYYELKENEEIFTSQEKNVSQAQRAQELAEARYKEGLATNADVTDAQQAFLQARVNMLQALYNYTVAQAKWEKAVGGQ
ncbi:transporter, partial [Candidatus Desantisbacteria bacterium CG_4_9_14_3_um_filter_50_7]